MVQTTSARGIKDLIHSEGSRLKAYKDSVGVWTIGVGHAATSGKPPIPHKGMTITKAEEAEILARDLVRYEAGVRKAFGKEVPQHVFDGAVSFHFNTGGINKASWVKKYKAGDIAGAAAAIMNWSKPPEIIGRRRRERDLIFDGRYYSPPVANEKVPTQVVGEDSTSVGWPYPLKKGMFNDPVVKKMQEMLKERNYAPGMADGDFGKGTEAAVLNWKLNNEEATTTSNMSVKQLQKLELSGPKPVSEKRAEMSETEVAEQSATASMAKKARDYGTVGGAVLGGAKAAQETGVLEKAEDYAQTAERAGGVVNTITGTVTDVISSLAGFFGDHWVWFVLAGGIGIAVTAHFILRKEVKETRAGEVM